MTIKQQGGVFGRHPEFSTVEIDGVGTIQKDGAKLNITAAGGVEIDGSQLFDLTVNGGVQINDERLRVLLTGNTSYAEIGVDYTSAYLRSTFSSGGTSDFRFLHNSSEIMRITGNGITFGGDTAAANALDDYEEGTWTPVLTTSATDYDAVSYSSSTYGRYTKVGNMVFIQGRIITTSVTVGSASGSAKIGGFPFNSISTNGYSAFSLADIRSWATGYFPLEMRGFDGQNSATLYYRSSVNGDSIAVPAANVGTGNPHNIITFAGCYHT